jgi:hypothetical protein
MNRELLQLAGFLVRDARRVNGKQTYMAGWAHVLETNDVFLVADFPNGSLLWTFSTCDTEVKLQLIRRVAGAADN